MDAFEIIGAFVDGERVNTEALKDALATDEGRQYFVDLALLREMTLADGHAPTFGTGAAATRPAAVSSSPVASGRAGWIAPVAAAAAIVIALTGGYAAGRHAVPTNDGHEQEIASAGPSRPAPAPTSIIRLEPGVDWHEQTPRN